MKLLLDTCTFLWLIGFPSRLSSEATRLVRDPANTLFLSVVSAWEIAVKYGLGKLSLQDAPERFVPSQRRLHRIALLTLREGDALYLPNLPSLHRDPFDRMLVCQSIVNKYPIVTPDPLVQQYPVQFKW